MNAWAVSGASFQMGSFGGNGNILEIRPWICWQCVPRLLEVTPVANLTVLLYSLQEILSLSI